MIRYLIIVVLLRKQLGKFFGQKAYLLEDKVGITTTNTLDGGDGEHDVPLTINVGVHHTQNVLERWGNHQRHSGSLEKIKIV